MCTVKGSAVVIESGFIAESADGQGHSLMVGQTRLWCFVYVLAHGLSVVMNFTL